MNQNIKIKNELHCTTIDIEGTIGLSEEWQFENPESRVATYERFRESVSQIADIQNSHIVVNIRSTGGDVNDAILIYEALRATGAHVTTRCYGYTASAATIVAQAASAGSRLIASSSLYLIHNSLCSTEGNAEELQAEVEMLKQTDMRIAEIYATRSGREVDEIAVLMAENGGRGCHHRGGYNRRGAIVWRSCQAGCQGTVACHRHRAQGGRCGRYVEGYKLHSS